MRRKKDMALSYVATMFIRWSVGRAAFAISLCGAIALADLAGRGAAVAIAADDVEELSAELFGWCMEAPALRPDAGNREAGEKAVPPERAARCERLSEQRARELVADANAYEAEMARREQDHAATKTAHRNGEDLLYRYANLCRQMQAIGSGYSSTTGLCLSGHEQLSASLFPFDRLHQEQLQQRLSDTETTRRALSMVLGRHPLGTRVADMLADLDRAGFSCDDVEDSISVATGDCQTSYFGIGYQNQDIYWFGHLIWNVGYRASGSGSLENVRVWIVGLGP